MAVNVQKRRERGVGGNSPRTRKGEVMNAQDEFDKTQRAGMQRHPSVWFIANQKAVQHAGLDMSVPANKALVSRIVLRVLDATQIKEK